MLFKKLFIVFVFSLFGSSYGLETFDSLYKKSQEFAKRIPFPTINNRIKSIAQNDPSLQISIAQQANAVRPIADIKVLSLMKEFLLYKKHYGTTVEQQIYRNMDVYSFIDRLLMKRPMMFMTELDFYLLRNGKKGQAEFEFIGTPFEKEYLSLNEYLSYDEMQISSLIGVSVPTFFINNGARNNKAKVGIYGTYQAKGIYTGLVGARFEKPGLMEWQHMVITPQQNTLISGYGLANEFPANTLLALWSKFYEERFPTFEEAQQDVQDRFLKLNETTYLNTAVYKKRLKMVIKPFLIDANDRAQEQGAKAYCHIVGLGLGVWQVSSFQAKLMLEVYDEIIHECSLKNIADIDFSWFPVEYNRCGVAGNLDTLSAHGNHIKIHFSKRNPADKLEGPDADKLLIAMYAWDGNAYPGNEYWNGQLDASGDPAAACCSTIAELQNPLINSNVCSQKLFVVK